MKQLAVIIDWFGPYNNLDDAKAAAKKDYKGGLYMAIGKTAKQKGTAKLQYIGISEKLVNRIGNYHEKLDELKKPFQIWLGKMASVGLPGKKTQVRDKRIDFSEKAHIYFLQLPLNNLHKKYPPKYPITVINRWWRVDYERKRKRRPHSSWPDIIDYMGPQYDGRIAWIGRTSGGKCKVWKPEDYNY